MAQDAYDLRTDSSEEQEQEIEELNRSSIDDNSRNEDGSLVGGKGEESSEEEDEDEDGDESVDDNFDLLIIVKLIRNST